MREVRGSTLVAGEEQQVTACVLVGMQEFVSSQNLLCIRVCVCRSLKNLKLDQGQVGCPGSGWGVRQAEVPAGIWGTPVIMGWLQDESVSVCVFAGKHENRPAGE